MALPVLWVLWVPLVLPVRFHLRPLPALPALWVLPGHSGRLVHLALLPLLPLPVPGDQLHPGDQTTRYWFLKSLLQFPL